MIFSSDNVATAKNLKSILFWYEEYQTVANMKKIKILSEGVYENLQ